MLMSSTHTTERKAVMLSPLIVLAESNLAIASRVENALIPLGYPISKCPNLRSLQHTFATKSPSLLFVGSLEEMNCMEIYRQFTNQTPNLLVIFLVDEPKVNNFFKEWVVKQGVYDVLSSQVSELPLLVKLIGLTVRELNSNNAPSSNVISLPLASTSEKIYTQVTVSDVINILQEITLSSMRYYGPMAIGNYWHLTHEALLSVHPYLGDWDVNYKGVITCTKPGQVYLSDKELLSLQHWVKNYLRECERIIKGFTEVLHRQNLTEMTQDFIFMARDYKD